MLAKRRLLSPIFLLLLVSFVSVSLYRREPIHAGVRAARDRLTRTRTRDERAGCPRTDRRPNLAQGLAAWDGFIQF